MQHVFGDHIGRTPPGNQILTLFDQPALYNHPRRCVGAVWDGQCHSVTLCHPLPYLLHVAPLERGRRHPRKAYDHQLDASPGQRCDARMMEHISSVTSGPVRPSSSLCCHPGYCRTAPNAVGTQVDRTSPRLPPCSFRSSVIETLKLVYGRRSDENSSANALEAAPGQAQEPPRHPPGTRFARTVTESQALCATPPHYT
jgi:hypothetical protein